MGDNWYCMIFGEELGPMSWDDLAAMAAHGTLGKRERVKQGANAQWLRAELVPGLFPAEITPEPSNDLDFEINESVRPASDGDTDFEISVQHPVPVESEASTAETDFDGAVAGRSGTDDDTDFDIAAPVASRTPVEPTAAAGADFDFAPPVKPAPAEEEANETDWDASAPAPPGAVVAPASPNDRDAGVGAATTSSSQHDAAARPHHEQPNLATSKLPPDVSHRKKPKEKSSGLSGQTKRALILILGVVGGLASAYLVYLGIVGLVAMRKPNYDEILAGYDQLFQQAQAAKGDSSVLGNPQATMEFLATLKTLRARLKNTDPDSADVQLAEAGTLLAQLFATAAAPPGSEAAQERKEAETAYLAKMSAVRNKLGE